ncbi:MAG: hypothetical protein P8M16_10000 [Acidimicrobiales bacterium]|nr:hypothetical protein [Acidimicrobiales bacterium]
MTLYSHIAAHLISHRPPVMVTSIMVAIFMFAGTGCSARGTSATSDVRTVVVLTADQAAEIVVPAGFTPITRSTTTNASVPIGASAVSSSSPAQSDSPSLTSTVPEPSVKIVSGGPGDEEMVEETFDLDTGIAATTTVTTTTAIEVVKETVPLAEEEINPGIKLMSALDEFNGCLDKEGYAWIGFPDGTQGPEAPVNQPAYLQALGLCNSKTGVADAFQSYETSRSDLSPEEIREENEGFIDLVDCLRGMGWTIGDLRPDEKGLLNPGDEFAGPDGGIVADDIRDCVSQISLAGQNEE